MHWAGRAHTAQSATAAHQSEERTPNLLTLRRLLEACDHELELLARECDAAQPRLPSRRRGSSGTRALHTPEEAPEEAPEVLGDVYPLL
jgi:hypothetical protein